MRRALALAAAALVLAGCSGVGAGLGSSGGSGDGAEVPNSGYVSGDQSVTLFAPAERERAVDLVATDHEGETIDLADWRGDVVVLNFWYADCPPCRVEAPDLAAVATDYAADGVRVLGINGRDDADRIASFNESFAIPYPSLLDSDARAVAALQGVVPLSAYPTTVVLDREGRPAARILGLATGPTLRGLVDDALAEPAA